MNTLFNLLIFSLPLGVIFRIAPFQGVAVYLYDLVTGIILFYFIFLITIRKKKIPSKKLFTVITIFLLIGFVSLIINSKYLSAQDFLISFAYLLRYASYASIIFAMQFLSTEFRSSVSKKLIIAGYIFVTLGFIQYFFYPNLRNLYYLGWDEHLYRFFSTFLDPNFAGTFLVLILILLSETIIGVRNEILKPFKGSLGWRVQNDKRIFVAFIMWTVTLVAIFLTYSRSALVMLLVVTSTFLIIHKFYRVVLVALSVFIISFFIFPNPNIQGLNPLRPASLEARIESAQDAVKIISKNPILGVGFNAYRYARMRYGLGGEEDVLESHSGAGTDNGFLFVLATTGIVGIIVFLDFWVNVFRIIIPKLKSEFYARVVLVSIISLSVNTIFINSLFYPPIMAWIFILVGLTTLETREK